jgi:hypothetical protein
MECKDEEGKAVARNIAEGIAQGIAKGIAIGIAFFIAFVLFIFLGGFVVQWLWNWLLPDIFGLRAITLWEALGLLLLSRIMFGGFGRGGGSHGPSRGRREWWKKPPDRANSAEQPGGAAS